MAAIRGAMRVCAGLLAIGLMLTHRAVALESIAEVYPKLTGELLLDNARVRVQRYTLAPGESTGPRTPGAQLLVFIRGGVLRSAGRSVLWRDGRVSWHPREEAPDPGSTNVGAQPIVLEWVTVKPPDPTAAPPGDAPPKGYLNYPNIPGEDLLENDEVIVQRFTVAPGQWEGVHAHHPDMLYIHIRGGRWAARSYREPPHPYPDVAQDGQVGWMPTIPLTVGHESGNIDRHPIDLLWVTLKQ